MDAIDGALVRFQPPAGRLTHAQLVDLTALSRRHADGGVMITRRAKIELRGVADTEALRRALLDAGLFLPRDRPVPDCVFSPVDDRDDQAVADARPVARAIISGFAQDSSAPRIALPDKFLVVVNGNGRAHTADVHGDLRFDAQPAESGIRWRVSLGGDAAGGVCLGHADSRDLLDLACVLAATFNDIRAAHGPTVRRVRHALDAFGPDAFHAAAAPWLRDTALSPAPFTQAPAGAARLGDQPGAWYGVGFAFGRIPAEALDALSGIERAGSGGVVDVRPMPDRRLLIVADSKELPLDTLRAAGAIDDPSDPRLQVAACIGQRGCRRATTDTRADAAALAETAPAPAPALDAAAGDIALHVSGCAKGCAYSRAAPVTLVGREGAYDLVVAGAPDAAPLARGLSLAAAGKALAAVERLVCHERRPNESAVSVLGRLSRRTLHDFIKLEVADV